jgi:hypothetical protein
MNQFYVRKKFMVFVAYLLMGTLLTAYGVDRYRFKGPKYQAPETIEAVDYFKAKCIEYKVQDYCAYGFRNLVRIDVVNEIWFQSHNKDIVHIGLAEYSVFSPLTKISIDKRLLADKVIFDTTVIHELGHAVLNLDHNDEKPAIMNSSVGDSYFLQANYEILINEMFKDFSDSVK